MLSMNATTSTPVRPLWWKWLIVWIAGLALFSLAAVFSRAVTGDFFNFVMFGATETPATFSPEAVEYQTVLFRMLAGVTIGWCATLAFVVLGPFRNGERWGWHAVAVAVVAWFVIDSGACIVSGFGGNAVLNTVLLVGAIPPLVATRPPSSNSTVRCRTQPTKFSE